jgi:hypothetical protein
LDIAYNNIVLIVEVTMQPFYPFIHKQERKKEQEPLPLYIELGPPPQKEEKEPEEEESRVVIIELF